MPQKILHCLFSVEEEKEMRVNGFGLDTHGIQHVVIQFERGKRKSAEGVAGLLDQQQGEVHAHPGKHRVKRPKNRQCKHCNQMFSGPGHWKHERSCLRMQKEKGGK